MCCGRAGALAQVTLTLCGQNATHKVYWTWYCEDNKGSKIVRDIGTGILPEVLLVVWQALLLPRVLYYIGQVRTVMSNGKDIMCGFCAIMRLLMGVCMCCKCAQVCVEVGVSDASPSAASARYSGAAVLSHAELSRPPSLLFACGPVSSLQTLP